MTVPDNARPGRLRRPGRGLAPLARREARWGYLFLAPWIIGFFAFTLIPMIVSLAFTFTNVNLDQQQPLQFVGLKNFAQLFSDPTTWDSLAVTIRFALFNLPIAIGLPFILALVMNSPLLRGKGLFRVGWFLPYVIPFVSGVFAWQGMLNLETGWVNVVLRFVGDLTNIDALKNPPNWLQDTTWIYPSLAFIGIWSVGAALIVNLAGLKGIPSELYDAARIDGAGWFAQLRNVTLPMMSPVIFYSLILGVVDVLQYFLVPLVLNNGTGEPDGTTNFFNLYLYHNFFSFQKMSYGATLAWLLFAVTLVVTLILFRTSRRWVFYAGER